MFNITNHTLTREVFLEDLDEIWTRTMRVIEERAAAYADDPLGSSGLYWRRFRIRGAESTQ
jgi:hypothetical protein